MDAQRANDSSIESVRKYLELHFPACVIHDRHDAETLQEVFMVENAATRGVHTVICSRKFLDDTFPTSKLTQQLELWKVAHAVRTSGQIFITGDGIITSSEP